MLAYWGFIDECETYDGYGSGIRGIFNYLKERSISYKPVKVRGVDGLGVANGDMMVLYVRKASAADHAEALEAYSKIRGLAEPASIPASIVYAALYRGNVGSEWAEALANAVNAVRENAGDAVRFPLASLHATLASNVDGDRSFIRYLLENEEVKVKKLLLEGRRREAAENLLYLLSAAAPAMSPEELNKFAEIARVTLGAALSIVHAALVSMLVSKRIESPEEAEELIRVYGESDSSMKLVLEFIKEYLAAVRDLQGYYASVDRGVQHAKLDGRRAYVRIGGASGHYAILWPSGSVLRLQYYDHDKRRMEALFGFLERIGLEVRDSMVIVPSERVRDVAVTLATLPSVDLRRLYHIYEEASSVEELVRLRRG